MKNQRSIEELLADMLRKQDRHEELLSALVEGQSKIVDVQSKLLETQTQMMETQTQMMETQTQMMKQQAQMAEGQQETNARLDSLSYRFDKLVNVLSDNWFRRVITLEDEMKEVRRKVG